MNKRLFLTGIVVLALLFSCRKDDDDNIDDNTDDIETGLPAFPGAEGFGAYATGGRGGDVVYVTNLNESGEGSLNNALGYLAMENNSMLKKRYILFKVSGIVSQGSLWHHMTHIEYGDFTLAGQTSPGGIVLRGLLAWRKYEDEYGDGGSLHQNNFIIRHIRSRPGGVGLDDAIRLNYAQNVIVDHCSFGWADDECMQISYNKNISVQNCIFAETLGEHYDRGGILIKFEEDGYPNTNISFHHNALVRLGGRLPQFGVDGKQEGNSANVEISNNLLWDPGSTKGIITAMYVTNYYTEGGYFVDYTGHFNLVNNYMYTLDVSDKSDDWINCAYFDYKNSASSLYTAGNQMNLYPDIEDKIRIPSSFDGEQPNARHDFPEITYSESGELMDYMVQYAGAFPRDAMDRRLMGDVESRTVDETPCNEKGADDGYTFDWAVMPIPELDSDDDGMPDWWELYNGLDPLEQDHNGTGLSSQYTGVDGYENLEVYLNRLSQNLTEGTSLTSGSETTYGSLIETFSIGNADNMQAGSDIEFNITLKDTDLEKLELSLDLLEAPFDWPSPDCHDITPEISGGDSFVFKFEIPEGRTAGDYSVMLHAVSKDGTHDYKIVDFEL